MSLVHGQGINDAPYPTTRYTLVGGKRTQAWRCPYYTLWRKMLERCYSDKALNKKPTYSGVVVEEAWKTFSNFREWVERQDQHVAWLEESGKRIVDKVYNFNLDKDILVPGSKIYSWNTSVLVPSYLNKFFLLRDSARGDFPIGVSWHSVVKKFQSRRRGQHLGYFDDPFKAHQAWQNAKILDIIDIHDRYSHSGVCDHRVSERLLMIVKNIRRDLQYGIETKNLLGG